MQYGNCVKPQTRRRVARKEREPYSGKATSSAFSGMRLAFFPGYEGVPTFTDRKRLNTTQPFAGALLCLLFHDDA